MKIATEMLPQLVECLQHYEHAKVLLDDILQHYDTQRQQFNTINTLRKAVGDAPNLAPKHEWRSESDILCAKIKQYLAVTTGARDC